MTPGVDVVSMAGALKADAEAHRHRRVLMLAGDKDWGRRCASEILEGLKPGRWLWLGEGPGTMPISAAQQHLGRELDLLVYDAHAGFDPDGFAAACGTLAGGGLLVLPAWPLDQWGRAPDPQRSRLTVHPFDAEDIGGRFLQRFSSLLRTDPVVSLAMQGAMLAVDVTGGGGLPSTDGLSENDCRTEDQAKAVEAVLHVVSGHRRRPLVMTADRGRGKSAALGIAVARLFLSGRCKRVVVTAPQRAAVDAVFEHADRLLPGASRKTHCLSWSDCELRFAAPDALITRQGFTLGTAAELVLVDEAAAMPTVLLERLVKRYSRLVFSTTVHGYEGSGRGFALRFGERLNKLAPGWQSIQLERPVRWAADDPLEALLFRALVMDAEPSASGSTAPTEALAVTTLDRDRLATDEALLRQVFGLLTAAHYRTSPLDLRHLLDGPNLQARAVFQGESVLATALVAEEGGFDADLAARVWAGQRRPKGHLLPQVLALQCGFQGAVEARALRIIRIAVHPDLRRRGLGRRLVADVVQSAQASGFDLVGASFAATPEVMAFWRGVGMRTLNVGSRPETTTGAHSVLVAQPVSSRGEALLEAAGVRFLEDFPAHLGDTLAGLDPDLVAAIAGQPGPVASPLAADDLALLAGFAHQRRPYESSRPVLVRLGACVLNNRDLLGGLSEPHCLAFVARVLQARPWAEVAEMASVSGRAELIALLREATAGLLAAMADRP